MGPAGCQYLGRVGPYLVCRHCNDHRPKIDVGACAACEIFDWPCPQPKPLPSVVEIEAPLRLADGRSRGLGDTVEKVLLRVGIKKWSGCWCNRWQARLNRWFPW